MDKKVEIIIVASCLIVMASANHVDSSGNGRLFSRQRLDLFVCPSEPKEVSGTVNGSLLMRFADNSNEKRINDLLGKGIEELVNKGFNLSQATLLYVHAYDQNPRSAWLKDVRRRFDEMFSDEKQNFNLLFYDWSFYAKRRYKEASSFVPVAGVHLGQFLDKFAEVHKYDMNLVHIVSFSLSTHIAGVAGRQVNRERQVGRITALDETGVCFHSNSELSREWSLRYDDARLVISKRYDWEGTFGPRQVRGGVNIFVNGGQQQPGVGWSEINGSHQRAQKHEVAFNDQCHEVAYACNSHAAFLAGECADCGQNGEKCYYMDSLEEMRLRPALGPLPEYQQNMSLFIETGPGPYCLHHYQVVVQMNRDALPSSLDLLKSGSVTFEFNREFEVAIKDYAGNNRFSTLALFEEPLGDIDEVKARVSYTKFWWSNEEFMKNVHHIDINYMSHPIAEERAKRSFQFCHHGCNLELPITACSKTC